MISLMHRRARASRLPGAGGPEEHIDQVLAAAVYQRRNRAVAKIFEPPALQRVSLLGEIVNRWREVQLAIEPGLHRMLVRGEHVGEVSWHEGPNVAGEHLVAECFTGGTIGRDLPASGGDQHQGRRERKRSPANVGSLGSGYSTPGGRPEGSADASLELVRCEQARKLGPDGSAEGKARIVEPRALPTFLEMPLELSAIP